MTPDQYRERVLAQLDAMRTHEKNSVIFGFIEQLFPNGDPDHEVVGSDFIAEAIRLLSAFHPCNLKAEEDAAATRPAPGELAF